MSKPEDKRVFLPITKHDDKLKVTAPGIRKPGDKDIEALLMTIAPDCPTYEKVPVSEFKEKNKNVVSAQETYFDKVGNQITNKPLTNDDIFRFRMLTNQAILMISLLILKTIHILLSHICTMMDIHLIIIMKKTNKADANVNSLNIHQRNVPSSHVVAVTHASVATLDAGNKYYYIITLCNDVKYTFCSIPVISQHTIFNV